MKLKLMIYKFFELLTLEYRCVMDPEFGLFYMFRRWYSFALNKKKIKFLDRTIHYENRMNALTMFLYLKEINRLVNLFKIENSNNIQVLDIGANAGYFGYTIANVLPKANIFSFEPNAEVFSYLKKNASTFLNWKVFNFGVSDKVEDVELYYIPGKSGQGSIYRENTTINILTNPIKITSSTVKLSPIFGDFIAKNCEHNHIELIKIDVEGAERSVLLGIKEVQWRHMHIELCTSVKRRGHLTIKDLFDLLHLFWPDARLIKTVKNGYLTDVYVTRDSSLALMYE